jgi:hypothetical protein
VYLFVTGPNLPSAGAKLSNPSVAAVTDDPDTFVSRSVSDGRWSYKWQTSGRLDAGTYTIFAVDRGRQTGIAAGRVLLNLYGNPRAALDECGNFRWHISYGAADRGSDHSTNHRSNNDCDAGAHHDVKPEHLGSDCGMV